MADSVEKDLAAIARIEAVPTILRTIRELTGLRCTIVARVLSNRWIACAVHDELPFGFRDRQELDVESTLCRVVRDSLSPVIIERASTDPVYGDHPAPRLYGFESYISVPIFRRNGDHFGTLCGMDPLPRPLNDGKTLSMMKLFGELISLQLEAEERHEQSRAQLSDEREAANLREQFIAVLGHDVRNPLSAIATGTHALLQKVSSERERRMLERIHSSTRRISGLVDDLTDLARGRLGGGIGLAATEVHDLPDRLRHVVEEAKLQNADRKVELCVSLHGPVFCEARRIEQLLSNLLANAIEHGTRGTPVSVEVTDDDRTFRVTVANHGAPIPEAVKTRLFQPYFRGGHTGRREGLGLGLYIVSEIARSHGGHLDVASTPERTAFTFTMPAGAPPPPRSEPAPSPPRSCRTRA